MSHPVSPRRVPGQAPEGTRPRRSRRWWWTAAAVLVVIAAVGAALFEPWRLFTRSSIDESSPALAAMVSTAPSSPASNPPTGSPADPTPPAPSTPVISAAGPGGISGPAGDPVTHPFVDGEHATSGAAAVLQLPDGRRFLRLTDLSTSDGPDVHVILSDRPSGEADWGVYDDGRHVELGELKATDGNQNYEIPADVDLAGLQSVVIWCDRFDVAFGTASLTA